MVWGHHNMRGGVKGRSAREVENLCCRVICLQQWGKHIMLRFGGAVVGCCAPLLLLSPEPPREAHRSPWNLAPVPSDPGLDCTGFSQRSCDLKRSSSRIGLLG